MEVTAVPGPARPWLVGLLRTVRGVSPDEAEKMLGRLPLRLADRLTRGQAEDLLAQLARERVGAAIGVGGRRSESDRLTQGDGEKHQNTQHNQDSHRKNGQSVAAPLKDQDDSSYDEQDSEQRPSDGACVKPSSGGLRTTTPYLSSRGEEGWSSGRCRRGTKRRMRRRRSRPDEFLTLFSPPFR